MLFAGVGIFGSNIALSRAAAKTSDRGPILRTAILMAMISSVLAGLVCLVALPYLMPQKARHLVTLAQVFVLVIPVQHIARNLMAVDQGTGNFRNFNITRAINYPLYVILIIPLVLCGVKELHWYVTTLLAAYVIATCVRLLLALRSTPVVGTIHPPLPILRDSVRFGLAGIVEPVYLQMDKAILLWLLDARSLGIYTAALSASAVLNGIANLLALSLSPRQHKALRAQGFPR